MANYLSPSCCCGCELFNIAGFFASDDATEVDAEGRTIATRALPAGGNWTIEIAHSPTDPEQAGGAVDFYLLRSDDSVYCHWRFDFTNKTVEGHFFESGGSYAVEWEDAIADVNGFGEDFPATFRLTVRPFGVIFAQPHDFHSSNDGQTDDTQEARYESLGFPVPSGALDDAGPLRFAAKIVAAPPLQSYDFSIEASRIEVEADEVGPAYGTTEAERPECPLPTACPVNYPSYTTPRFDVTAISGDGLPSSTRRQVAFDVCASRIEEHGPKYTRTDFSNAELALAFDSATDSGDIKYYVPVGGSEPLIRPVRRWIAAVDVLEGSSASERIIAATLYFSGYTLSQHTESGAYYTFRADSAEWDGDSYELVDHVRNPDYLLAQNFLWAEGGWSIEYRKAVPAWEGTPPSITFDSNDIADTSPAQPGDVWHVVDAATLNRARWWDHLSVTGQNAGEAEYAITVSEIAANNYAFTIGPEDAGFIPNL